MPALWVAAAGAVAGAVAGSQEQGGGTTQTSSTSEPWKPQQPFITYGFDQAKDLYGKASQNPVYQGNRVAALNPFQTNIANLTGNYSQDTFGNAYTTGNLGQSVATTGSQFAGNASNLFNQYSNLNGAMDYANSYANSPVAQGLIDASGRDITRNLYENQLPTLAKAAAGSGNTNSTRAGVESAIAQRGAADRLADVSSGIRSNFFNQGVNQYNTNLANSLAANTQLYSAYGAGNQGMLTGQQMAENSYNLGTSAGGIFQNQDQNEINATMQKFSEENNVPMDLLQKYMNLIGGNYGSSSTGTSTAPTYGGGVGGALTGALGGASAGAGIYGKLNSGNNSSGKVASSGTYANNNWLTS